MLKVDGWQMADYEDELLNKFGGGVKKLRGGLAILFIADTHGDLCFHSEILDGLRHYDLCILLGDHSEQELKIIKSKIDNEKLFGVLGNHDLKDQYTKAGIRNLSGAKLTINGIVIGGLGGSFQYKDSPYYPLLSHEKSIELADRYDEIDILISHDKPYLMDTFDIAHDGLKGITHAIYKNHIPFHFHGHLHKQKNVTLKNGCQSRCIYGVELI